MTTNEELIAIWAKAVDTQMHFNEMSVRSRQLGLTFVTAALALGVVLMSQGDEFSIEIPVGTARWTIHVSVLLVMAALLGLQAVKRLDLTVYHRMLRGAVAFGEDFEQNYMKKIFDLDKGMTQAISFYSRYDDAYTTTVKNRKRYNGCSEITAELKIRRFYSGTTIALAIAALALFVFTNVAL